MVLVMKEIQVSATKQTLKCIANILRSIETINGAIGRGTMAIWWPLLCLRFYTHWQLETLLVTCQTLSKVVICCYCHSRTKTCDHKHTKIMKLHTFSVILHFSWQTNTWHWMLLTPQYNICVCVCVCAHTHTQHANIWKWYEKTTGPQLAICFYQFPCNSMWTLFEIREQDFMGSIKILSTIFQVINCIHSTEFVDITVHTHSQWIQLRKSALFTIAPYDYHFKYSNTADASLL